MLSEQILRCSGHPCLPSTMSCMMIVQRLLCHVTWPNHDIFQRLTAERRDLSDHKTFDFVPVHWFSDPSRCGGTFSRKLFSKAWIFFCSNRGYSSLTPVDVNGYRPVICRAWIWTLILLFHILSSLTVAGVAVMSRVRISTLQVLPFEGVAPMYLKLDTFSRGSPSMVMLALVMLLLFTITVAYHSICTFHMRICFNSMTDIKRFLQNLKKIYIIP